MQEIQQREREELDRAIAALSFHSQRNLLAYARLLVAAENLPRPQAARVIAFPSQKASPG